MVANACLDQPVVYVVDDDPQTCKAVSELIHSLGYQVRTFETPTEFLDSVDTKRPGCVVLDLRMPQIDGLAVHDQLTDRKSCLSVILLTAYAETRTTVRTIRNGALAVVDKPIRDEELWGFVQEGIQRSEQECVRRKHLTDLEKRFRLLAAQDREVLRMMLEGVKNRNIAKQLDVSLRTVENRRRRVFDILQANSVAELARMVTEFEHGLAPKKNAHDCWMGLPHEKVPAQSVAAV